MSDLVSLERSPKEEKAIEKDYTEKPYFPLQLYLGDEDMKKLKVSGLKQDQELMLVARVRVTSTSTSTHAGHHHESATLSLVEGCLEQPTAGKKTPEEQAASLFGGNKA